MALTASVWIRHVIAFGKRSHMAKPNVRGAGRILLLREIDCGDGLTGEGQ